MRKLIVSNMMTLDGYYDGPDKNLGALFKYFHADYSNDDAFDFYNVALLRAADYLMWSRASFLSNKAFWTGLARDPNATAIRRETAQLMASVPKLII